jgi:hypothetical protein
VAAFIPFRADEDNQLNSVQKSVANDERRWAELGVGGPFSEELVAMSIVHGREDIAGILIWTITIKGYVRLITGFLFVITALLAYIALHGR